MNPQNEQPKEEPKTDVATPPNPEAPQGQVAEPPKNLEFHEVPADGNAPRPNPSDAPQEQKPEENKDGKPEGEQPKEEKPKKPEGPKGPKMPVFAISAAFILFAALAVVAYLAYTKSQ